MYILIGADLVPTRSNLEYFINGDAVSLVGSELMDVLKNAACRIFNLEVPLTDTEKPIIKQGPNLIAPSRTVNGYKALGVDLLTLANNHILDQHTQGLESTIATLDNAEIKHLGAANTLSAASKPYVFSFAGKKIGVYACSEHEFSIAGENKPGANPFDPLWSFDHVEKLKDECDFLIVLYHGGKEHYRYPSPMLQKLCRRFVDKGANLVVCQHSHCVGCQEKYQDGTIVYGQGNFIFDNSDDEYWKTSLLIRIDEDFTISYLPLCKAGYGVRLADEETGTEIMDLFRSRSDDIKRPGYIETTYSQFADSYLEFYLRALSGKQSVFFRVLNKLSRGRFMHRYLQNRYSKGSMVKIANYIDCEAHRELLSQAIENGYRGKRQ